MPLRVPKIFNLRTDPYERADITSNTYYDWIFDHAYLFLPAQAIVARVPGDVQGVPAAPEGGQLHHRPGDGEDERGRRRRGALDAPAVDPPPEPADPAATGAG